MLWLGAGYLRHRTAARQHAAWLSARNLLRRQVLSRDTQSTSAQERLGDLLCEMGDLTEAISCYERALELIPQTPLLSSRAGRIPGVGLRIKLRMARLELASPAPTERMRRARREPLCRVCGALGWSPEDRICPICGEPLLMDRFFDTMRQERMRRAILRESAESAVMIVLATITLRLGCGMSLVACCCLTLAMSLAISLRLIRNFGGV